MERRASALSVVILITTALSASAQQPGRSSPEQNAIQESARTFVQAYDAGNASAVAALWAEDGEYIIGPTTVKGRPAIQRVYEDFFRGHPGSKMEVEIDSIRVLAPTVAIEQGTASVSNSPSGPPSRSAYTAVHTKQGGRWLMASVRDSPLPTASAGEDLQQLTWLVGDWAAWGDAANVEVNYEWIANNHFLRGETIVRPSENADSVPGGLQIIGRDLLTGQIVSWFFNADGGHGYGVWTREGPRWLIRTQGATADGVPTTATNVIYHADDNVLSWQSVNRTVGDQRLPNTPEIVIERVSSGAAGNEGNE